MTCKSIDINKIDKILTSRWLGFPILIAVLYAMFQCTFTFGTYPQEWIESGIDSLCVWMRGAMREGWFTSMLVDGVVTGVGAVLSLLPNIIIMFFFLSILEDCGYMHRAAYLMDKLMHRLGLHGRSFIPLLIGFGCNVPAIMAARNIDNWKDRALTMLMIPFMSCSARLPVYVLFVGAFFPVKYRALIIMLLYALGIVLAILFAVVMKHTRWFRKKNDSDVSELPPFRRPTWHSTGRLIWDRCWDYLQKIATVILVASIVIWGLQYFPREREVEEQSYLVSIGQFIEPVMAPLGFDWRLNVCLLTGLPAKEAIVSTVGILYKTEDEGTMVDALCTQSGITPLVAFGFMLFVQLYFPCIATLATLRRELGRRWAAFSLFTSLSIAWIVSFLVFQIGSLL